MSQSSGIESPQTVTVQNGRFRIQREYDPSVRVPNFVLKCVGFVGEVTHRDSSGPSGDLHATGLFLAVPCGSLVGGVCVYFVTAKHVADDLKDREIYFLVNKIGGGSIAIESASMFKQAWWFHPTDPTADVAITQIKACPEADIISVHVDQIATPELLRKLDVGIGDEVFATGLFTPAPGVSRNVPILRHGNIAMMPEEQIQTELGFADVYLVEARSIGGLSGSPVFVRNTLHAKMEAEDGEVVDFFGVGHGATLLGIMQGHWDIKESEMNKASFTHDSKRGVNLGVGIVVPAIKILDIINRRELVEYRQRIEQLLSKKMVPGTDSAKRKEKEEPTFTQQDFDDAMLKVSRKIEPQKN